MLGFSCDYFRVFAHLDNFEKLDPSVINSLSFPLKFLENEALHLFGSMHYFDRVGHEILQNRYLKTNFENTEIRDSVPTF